MSEFLRLRDLGRWSSGGTPPKADETAWNGTLPWISAKDIDSTQLRAPSVFITEQAGRDHSAILEPGSLMIIVRGMALAHGLPVVMADRRCAFNQDLRGLTPDLRHDPRFLHYSLIGHRRALGAHIDKAAHGTARVVDSIYYERIWCPPTERQQAVAEFLDGECERIAAAVASFTDLTAALDRNLEDWFQDAISDVRTVPLRRVIDSVADGPFGSSLATAHYVDDPGVRVIRLGDIGLARFRDQAPAYVANEYASGDLAEHRVAEGELVMAGLGDAGNPLGRSAVVPPALAGAIHKADCYRIRVDRRRADADYLAWGLSFGPARDEAPLLSRGSTRARLNTVVARDLPIPFLPLDEQRTIVANASAKRNEIDAAARCADVLQVRLAEYRDALITEAVTGQFNVTKVSETQMDERLDAATR